MKSVVKAKDGIKIVDVPKPVPGKGQYLVKVKANSVNRADLLMIDGIAHFTETEDGFMPLGLEFSGVVEAVGEGAAKFKVGDRIMGSGNAADSEYVLADDTKGMHLPDSVSFEQGTCFPVAMRTMHDAIVNCGQMQKGQTVMFQGASSAVGLLGMQIAKYLGAGKVIGTTNKTEQMELLKQYGADVALNTTDEDWPEQVLRETDGKGVDILIDFLAGPLVNKSMSVVKLRGRMVNIGRVAGEQGQFDFNLHNMRSLIYIGSSNRGRSPEYSKFITEQTEKDLLPAMEAGALKMPVDSVWPMEKIEEAFDRMAQNKHFGKILLTQD